MLKSMFSIMVHKDYYIFRFVRERMRYNKVCRFCFRESMKLGCKGNCRSFIYPR